MFDSHAHIGLVEEAERGSAIVCTSRSDEYSALTPFPHRAYGLLDPDREGIDHLIGELEKDRSALIGEVGVDRRWENEEQEELLLLILSYAKETGRPFVIHQVGKFDMLQRVLSKLSPLPPFMVHGFTGSAESARLIMKMGGIISLSPRAERSRHFNELLKLPFLLESDLALSQQQRRLLAMWYGKIAQYLGKEIESVVEMVDEQRAVLTP